MAIEAVGRRSVERAPWRGPHELPLAGAAVAGPWGGGQDPGMDPVERERMKRWRASVAAGAELHRREALEEAARLPPGEKIALALRLSAAAGSFAATLSREEKVAPAALWRRRHHL